MNEDGFESMVDRNINTHSPFRDELIEVYHRSRRSPAFA
jgi:hypothetical protein